MKKLTCILGLILLLVCSAPASAALATDVRAVVIVFSRSIDGTSCGNGFVIGDGTLLVTARHNVFPEQPGALHQGDAFITVLSPFLGDACEAEVVAQDRTLDLVILRESWLGHPALRLADEKEVLAAGEVDLASYGEAISAVTAAKPSLLAALPPARVASETINAVTVRGGRSSAIVIEAAPPGAGWSGAPLIPAGSSTVVGCYSRTRGNGSAGSGAAAGAIEALIAQAKASAAIGALAQPQQAPQKAAEAAAFYLQSVAASAAQDPAAAYAHVQAFLTLRPQSAIGYRDAAGLARALNRLDDAQRLYASAIEMDPKLISARVLYGQLLHERIMPTYALEHLRYAWNHGGQSTAAAIPLCNILREQSKEDESLKLLEAALQRNPQDSHLWTYLAQSRRALKDHAGAASAFARSADLLPANESARFAAADEFLAAGSAAEAEKQYRLLLDVNEQSAAGHYALARLLARDPQHREEAMREAQAALRLAGVPGAPPREPIMALIGAIRAGRTVHADELSL